MFLNGQITFMKSFDSSDDSNSKKNEAVMTLPSFRCIF